jgi:hypothetical protein
LEEPIEKEFGFKSQNTTSTSLDTALSSPEEPSKKKNLHNLPKRVRKSLRLNLEELLLMSPNVSQNIII